MVPTVRARFWMELGLAALSTVSLVLTLVWAEWIELLTGLDPDKGSGSAEWAIAGASATAAIAFAQLTRRERHRAAVAT